MFAKAQLIIAAVKIAHRPDAYNGWFHSLIIPLLKTPFYEILVFKNLMILLTGSLRPPAFAGVLMKTEEACHPKTKKGQRNDRYTRSDSHGNWCISGAI